MRLIALLAIGLAVIPPLAAQDQAALITYSNRMTEAHRRGPTDVAADIAARIRAVPPPSGYDSLHALAVARADDWAKAEARYLDAVGGSPGACSRGLDASDCGDPTLRQATQGQRLRSDLRQAYNRLSLAEKALHQRLAKDGLAGTAW